MATDFWKFTLRYSLALLGGLYIALVALATYLLFFRMNTGSAQFSPLGYWGGLLYLVLLALAFFFWLYGATLTISKLVLLSDHQYAAFQSISYNQGCATRRLDPISLGEEFET